MLAHDGVSPCDFALQSLLTDRCVAGVDGRVSCSRTTVCGPMSCSASQAARADAVSRTARPVSSSASKLLGVTTLRRLATHA